MNVYNHNRPDNHPSISFLYLLITVILSTLLFMVIGLGLGFLFFREGMNIGNLNELGNEQLNFLSLSQICSAIGAFVVPPLILNRIDQGVYFDLRVFSVKRLYLLILILMLVSAPFFEYTIHINEGMKLPEFLHGLERWMKMKEDQTKILTEALLSRRSWGAFFLNLLMAGVIAAVGEELTFRGCLQRIIAKWTNKPILAIWITAIVFSAFHLQFYGFLPRMLIGALCGYLYYWSGSIWLSIWAHFINNAATITIAFFLSRSGKSLDTFEFNLDQWPQALGSFVAGAFILYLYKKKTDRKSHHLFK